MRRLLAAVFVLAATLPSPLHAQVPEERSDVRIDVRGITSFLTPASPTFNVRARIVNTTGEPVRNLRSGLRFGSQLLGRSAIAAGGGQARGGTRVGDKDVPAVELAPGETTELGFDLPLTDLPFDRNPANAVYPVRIEVRSRFEVVGALDTFVVWWPQAGTRLRVAMLWPLVEPSHRALGNDFYDEALAESMEDGRLASLLALGESSPIPVTWAVDPELLDSASRMAGQYTVNGRPGTKSASARAWLDDARNALRDDAVVPLPYADPDLATTSAGSLAVGAGSAFQLGRDIVSRELGIPGDPSLAWPPSATLSPSAESLLAAQGVKGVVVPESALPLGETLNYTPTAPTPLAPGALGAMTALVAETQLNRWVGDPVGPQGVWVAVQRFLADTAMAAMERPGIIRDVVIAPPRTWEPVSRFATELLRQIKNAPWLAGVPLGDVLKAEPSGIARTRTPPDGALLAAAHVERIVTLRRSLQRLRGILTDPENAPPELAQLDDALLRAASSRWSAEPGKGVRLLGSADDALSAQRDRLRIVPAGVVTMTGRSGRIPLTFQNELGQPVRIRVRIESNDRLAIEGDTAYETRTGGEVSIPSGTSTLVINGRATTGGLFNIKVEVLSNDGTPLGIGTTLKVRSTAYGVVALAVTGVAFGLLLVASATRLLRRRRQPPSPTPEPEREPQPA